MAARAVGVAFSPWLLVNAPAALLVLSPYFAHLLVLSGVLSPVVFYGLGFVACAGHCAAGYGFGRLASARAQGWLVNGGSSARLSGVVGRVSGWLRGASPLVLVCFPGPVTSGLAGLVGTAPRAFFPVMAGAQVAWLLGCGLLGARLAQQVGQVRAFVAAHVLELTGATLVVVLVREGVKRLWARRA